MTVLSGPYITRNRCLPMFGRPDVRVLECLNCPVVKDVQVRTGRETGHRRGSGDTAARRRCRRREVVGRVRRSKNGPEPSARGNFTPPPRGEASAQVPAADSAAPAKSGSRLSPRNWRVPTRLNAILLIPVGVGLVMGGF